MRWIEIPDWARMISDSLMRALLIRDPYTFGHCRRVGHLSKELAKAAGLGPFEQQVVEYASIFHDLGKIGIPDYILNKPGRLNEEEEAIMREHPIKSEEIMTPLAHLPFFRATLPGIRHHHERIDGKGYPDGISGDKVPLVSRIILIADTYDAMTSTRPYRKGLTPDIAYKELKIFANRQFDEQLVKMFIHAHPHWQLPEQAEIPDVLANIELPKAA